MYNPVYKLVHKYEYLTPISATAGVGLINFGPIGLTFAAFGTVDVVAKYYQIYDKPYLTSSVIGWATLSSFKTPYYIADITGAAGGLLLPTGILNNYIKNTITTVSGAIYGYSYLGHYGIGIGVAGGIADEILSYNNITHSYPLTTALKAIANTKLAILPVTKIANYIIPDNSKKIKGLILQLVEFINKKGVQEVIGIGFAAKKIHYTYNDDIKVRLIALELKDKVYDLYSKIIPEEQLNTLIAHQYIANGAAQVILARIGLIFIRHKQDFSESFTLLRRDSVSQLIFNNKILITSINIIPYAASQIISDYINAYFQTKLNYLMEDLLNDELQNKGVIVHLKQNRTKNAINTNEELIDSKIIIENLNDDISTITSNTLLSDILAKSISGVYAIGHLASVSAVDVILYSSLYNQLTRTVTHFLSEKYSSFNPKIEELNTNFDNKYDYTKLNAYAMDISNANNFNKAAQREILENLREVRGEQTSWGMVQSIWNTIKGIANQIVNYIFVAEQIYKGLSPNLRTEVISMVRDYSNMVSWEADNIGSITTLGISMNRIIEGKARMDEVNNPLEHFPTYIHKQSNQNGLCLNNFRVGVENKVGLYIDKLCMSGIVAVTSASAAGKTTLFKALAQIVHTNGWSEGDITYFTKDGNQPFIAMTSQSAYLSPEDTLLELMTFKKAEEAEQYRQQAIEYMEDSSLRYLIPRLDNKEDWFNILSGGQKQLVAIARLILQDKKPDIIFFDEPLTGLDPSLVKDIQQVILKSFSDSFIMIIDHEIKAHNPTEWCLNILHLENGTAHLLGVNDKE